MATRSNMRIRVNIDGVRTLDGSARAMKQRIIDALPGAVLAGSDLIAEYARSIARRKSGALARGIISTVTWDKNAPVAFAGAGMDKAMNDVFVKYSANGKRYYYPASIEYGHPGAPAFPFLRPAHAKKKAAVRKEISARIKRIIEGAGG